jgi:nucleotide-binding universal stress UspA family protein
VVSVWESEFSFALRHGRGELTGVVEDLAAEVEASSAERAQTTAEQGAEIAAGAGFGAEPVPSRAISRILEREHAAVWRTIVEIAEDQGAAAIAAGSRGLSGMRSAVLGSVSNGVLQHAERPGLLVPSTPSGDG